VEVLDKIPIASAGVPIMVMRVAVARPGGLDAGSGMTLQPEPQSARKAREFVRERLRSMGFPLDVVSDGATVATELVTNAVTYAHGTPCLIMVGVSPRGRRPVIEVHDSSPQPPVQQEPDFIAERGRGLHIVAELCAGGWEYFPTATGKAVVAWLR
jgi:anti-sigma regulatory factor (Ser/Thr protein kinase)